MIKIITPDCQEYSADTPILNVIRMRDEAFKSGRYGPFVCYFSGRWRSYLDKSYGPAGLEVQTVYPRLLQIESIKEVLIVDWLTGWKVLLSEQIVEGI